MGVSCKYTRKFAYIKFLLGRWHLAYGRGAAKVTRYGWTEKVLLMHIIHLVIQKLSSEKELALVAQLKSVIECSSELLCSCIY